MPFITFEGVEGSGKSTQVKLAAARLRGRRRPVLATREPGGTRIGRVLRRLLLTKGRQELDSVTEWLLFEADRRQHVLEVIRPALAAGLFVLCDRFSDATEAYQQVGRRLDRGLVGKVDALARDGIVPDLTLLYDLDPREGLARAHRRGRGTVGRFEKTEIRFHEDVRRAYLRIAKRDRARVRVLDASQPAAVLFRETWSALSERFGV